MDDSHKESLYRQLLQDHTPFALFGIATRIVKAEEERDNLRALLLFATENADHFTECDPDGVKAAWIRSVRTAINK